MGVSVDGDRNPSPTEAGTLPLLQGNRIIDLGVFCFPVLGVKVHSDWNRLKEGTYGDWYGDHPCFPEGLSSRSYLPSSTIPFSSESVSSPATVSSGCTVSGIRIRRCIRSMSESSPLLAAVGVLQTAPTSAAMRRITETSAAGKDRHVAERERHRRAADGNPERNGSSGEPFCSETPWIINA